MRRIPCCDVYIVCVLYYLSVLPVNCTDDFIYSGKLHTRRVPYNELAPSKYTVNLMTERAPVSKAMRDVLRYIFNFHDARLKNGEVILTSEQSVDEDSKKIYEDGKRGGQNEFEEINIFNVERSKILNQKEGFDDEEVMGDGRNKEGKHSFVLEPTRTRTQSDEELLRFETNVYGLANNDGGSDRFSWSSSSTMSPKETGNLGAKDTAYASLVGDDNEDNHDDGDIFLGSSSTCDHVTGYYRQRWLRLVVKCPSHWTNETVRKLCETWDEKHGLTYIDEITMLPVQDSLGTVYGNAFCAICHNAYPIYPWTTVLQCNTPTDYSSKTMSLADISNLNLSFLQNLQDNSYCKRTIMPSIPTSIERCENHHSWPKSEYFRSNPLDSLGIPSSFPVNFNVLMNFDFAGDTHILFSAGQQVVQNEYVRRCNVGETFDTYSNMCRPVRCGDSHRLQAGKCVPLVNSTKDVTVSDDFDVAALHETAKVSLSVNISFGVYLIFKEQDDLNSIVVEQIADNLNISMDRIKHVNVSFDFGSINKTGYQVQKLSQQKYREYFPNDTDLKGDTIRKPASIFDTFEYDKDSRSDHNSKEHQVSQRRRKRTAIFEQTKINFVNKPDEPLNYQDDNVIYREESPANPDDLESANGLLQSDNEYDDRQSDEIFYEMESESEKKTMTAKNKRLGELWKGVLEDLIDGRDVNRNMMLTSQYEDLKNVKENNNNRNNTNSTENEKILDKRKVNYSELDGGVKSLNKSISQKHTMKKVEKTKTTERHNEWQKIQGLSFNHLHPNTSYWDTLWSLLQPLDHQRSGDQADFLNGKTRQAAVNDSNVTDSSNSGNKIYLSPPLNEANERMLLGASSEIDFDQPMAMRISFILVPPDDPESDEEQAMVLLKKISDLITDREFTLLVSGNEVSVVNSDDPEEDEEKANQFCPWGVMFIVYDDEFSILEIDNITMLYVNKTKTYHGIGRFDLWVMVKGKNSEYETSVTKLREYAFVCFMPRIQQVDCQRITLVPDEYKVMSGDNRSIIFEEREYNITTYSVLNETTGEIQICVPEAYDPNKGQLFPHYFSISKGCGSDFDDIRRAESYLTIILGRISIAAQALVLVTYFLFPSLRNLPGCNIMNLTIALFIAETIFEEGMLVTTEWRCVTVAITLHFFFLASHFWMNVMSFDVFRAFSKANVSNSSSGKTDKQSYFPKYFAYAWGMPAIIVGICSFIEFSDLFSDVEIGYAGTGTKSRNSNVSVIYSNFLFGDQQNVIQDINVMEEDIVNQKMPTNNVTFTNSLVKESQSACWIQNPLASLIAFGAPVLIIFILNCIFFTRTIINISRTVKLSNESLYRQHSQHSNSSYTKTTGRSEAMLYLRMSTVMGFTWVFGFSSAIISSVANEINTTICVIVHVHSILFIIFNVSQGLFIFFAFVCNRRVVRLYRGLFFRLQRIFRRQSRKSRVYSVSSGNSTTSRCSKSTSVSSISW